MTHREKAGGGRLLILINPHSGRANKDLHLGKLLRALEEETQPFSVLFSQKAGDLERITRDCGGLYNRLFIAGGDGSVNEVFNGLMHLPAADRPALGILPTGSTCDYARTLGISKSLPSAVHQLLRGKILQVDAGQFQDRFFTYVASFGAFSAISYETPAELKHRIGHLAYLIKGIQGLSALDSHALTIEIDGQVLRGKFLFGAVTNTQSIGGLIRLKSRDVSLRDGSFELLLLRDPSTPLLRPAALLGMLNPDSQPARAKLGDLLFLRGKEIRFQAAEDLAWTLDGEFGGNLREVRVRNKAQEIPILVPASQYRKLQSNPRPLSPLSL